MDFHSGIKLISLLVVQPSAPSFRVQSLVMIFSCGVKSLQSQLSIEFRLPPPVIIWLNPINYSYNSHRPYSCSTSPTEISSQTIDSASSIQTCIFMHYVLKVGLQSQHTQEQSPKKTWLYHLPFCIQRVHSLGQVASQVAISGSATTFTLSSSPCSSPSSAWRAPWNKPTTKYKKKCKMI